MMVKPLCKNLTLYINISDSETSKFCSWKHDHHISKRQYVTNNTNITYKIMLVKELIYTQVNTTILSSSSNFSNKEIR